MMRMPWVAKCSAFAIGTLFVLTSSYAQTLLLQSGGAKSGGVGAYHANAVHFDGSSTYLSRGANLTGIANNKQGIVSFWFKMQGGDATIQTVVEDTVGVSPGGQFQILRLGDNTMRVFVFGGTLASLQTTSTFVSGGGWTHLLAAWDGAATTAQLFINNVSQGTNSAANNTPAYTTSTDWGVGGRIVGAPAQLLTADVADLYINLAGTLDLTQSANRAKFINQSTLKPVDLGSTGTNPTGSQPIVWLHRATASWNTSDGSGLGFTSNGTGLTTAATSPSD